MGDQKISAIIVAAGKGTRMKADCPKQFIEVLGRPILYYTLKAFEQSEVDEVIVVTSESYVEYVKTEIVEKYNLQKVVQVIAGGNERYESVYRGLIVLKDANYVLIHDGARPFVKPELIHRIICSVKEEKAVIAGVKTKDTIKVVNRDGYVEVTPDRDFVWNIQTPQAFEYNLLKRAYNIVMEQSDITVTDDAMVVEYATDQKIKVIEGCYTNIKITTEDDLRIEYFCGL